MLKHLELAYNEYGKTFYHHDSNNKPVGIYPYDVFDDGITFGYGHHASYKEVSKGVQSEIDLLNKYGVLSFVHTGGNPDEKMAVPITRTDGQEPFFMTLDDAFILMKRDVQLNENALHDFFADKNIVVTQIEFDALIIHRYLNGTLGDDIFNLLVDKNRDRSEWWNKLLETIDETSVFSDGWSMRAKKMLKLFFDGYYDYVKEEVL